MRRENGTGRAALAVVAAGLVVASCTPGGEATDLAGLVRSGAVAEGDSCPLAGTTLSCQSEGPVLLAGQEVCVVGERRCVEGRWTACEGLVAVPVSPTATAGVARGAVLGTPTICGGCDPRCYLTRDRPDDVDLTSPEMTADGVTYDAGAGGIVIGGPTTGPTSRYAWISSHGSNVVNKLNMVTLTNDGVYRTGRDGENSNPSRTTIDGRGFVYVGSRDNAAVTKISGEQSRCIDVNGNGVIDTSTGIGDLRGAFGSANQDECIIWDVRVGDPDGKVRGLALDARGRLWVGLHTSSEYWVLDTETGGVLAGPIPVDHQPYGAAIGPDGMLWSSGCPNRKRIQAIDTRSATPSAADVRAPVDATVDTVYGIAVDGASRVFVSSGTDLSRYDPATGTWLYGTTGSGSRGLSVDDAGRVYVASTGANAVSVHDAETLDLVTSWPVSSRPLGTAPDFWGRVWAANNGSADAAVVDPGAGTTTYIPTYSNNYTYSDFTGFGFAIFTNPTGSFTRVYEAASTPCVGDREATTVHYETVTPGSTVVAFYARAADSIAALGGTPDVFLGETPPAVGRVDLATALRAAGQDPRAEFIEVRVVLSRNGSTESPVVRRITLEEYCL